jgi:hypothetical protein
MEEIEIGEEVIIIETAWESDKKYNGAILKLREKETRQWWATCHVRKGSKPKDYVPVKSYARATPLMKALF